MTEDARTTRLDCERIILRLQTQVEELEDEAIYNKARAEKAEEFGRGNQARAVKAEARVEKLELKDAEETEALRERILELERERESLNERLGWTDEEWKTKHLITDEMIDAAWKHTEDLRDGLQNLEQPEIEKIICNTREELMQEFNIFYCEGCDGKGHWEQEPQTGGAYPEQEPICPDCNGYGWVIGGEDE